MGAYECTECSPTAVTLNFFTATATGAQRVALAWETAQEVDTVGFHVYRIDDGQSGETRITANLIAAVALPGQGAFYELNDVALAAGMYVYRLVAVNVDGSSEVLGEQEVDISVPTVVGMLSAEIHTPPPAYSFIAILSATITLAVMTVKIRPKLVSKARAAVPR